MFRKSVIAVIAVVVLAAACRPVARIPELSRMKWNPRAYREVTAWLDRLRSERPATTIVVTDCDNTVWAGDISDAMIQVGVKHGFISWKNAPVNVRFMRKPGADPVEYRDQLNDVDAIIAYNYAPTLFAGLTLNQTREIFERTKADGLLPKPYPAIRELMRCLDEQGFVTGFVSASVMFMIAPMLEEAGYDVPLWRVEGLDVYVEDPRDTDREVLLSDLIQTAGLEDWQSVLDRYGNLKIGPRAGEAVNAREGKALGVLSIASRHVWRHNARKGETHLLSVDDMRLGGVLGDNFAPFSDLPGASPRAAGNDQGLVRSLPFVDAKGIVLNIYRGVNLKDGALDMAANRGNYERFRALAQQLEMLGANVSFVNQVGIAAGNDRGSFSATDLPLRRRR